MVDNAGHGVYVSYRAVRTDACAISGSPRDVDDRRHIVGAAEWRSGPALNFPVKQKAVVRSARLIRTETAVRRCCVIVRKTTAIDVPRGESVVEVDHVSCGQVDVPLFTRANKSTR
jgi:hypothetical protein